MLTDEQKRAIRTAAQYLRREFPEAFERTIGDLDKGDEFTYLGVRWRRQERNTVGPGPFREWVWCMPLDGPSFAIMLHKDFKVGQ